MSPQSYQPPLCLFAIPDTRQRHCTSAVQEKVHFRGARTPPDHGSPYPLVAPLVLIESAVAAVLRPKHAHHLDDLTGHQQAGYGGSGSATGYAVVRLLRSRIRADAGMAYQGSGGCC